MRILASDPQDVLWAITVRADAGHIGHSNPKSSYVSYLGL